MITTINEFKKYLILESVEHYNLQEILDNSEVFMDDEYYIFKYIDEENIHIDDINDTDELNNISETDDYKNWYKHEIEYLLDEYYDLLNDLFIENNTCIIYRMIDVNDVWFDNLKSGDNLGIYWSYKKDAVDSHWSDGNKNSIILSAKITPKNIDYHASYNTILHPHTGIEEKEIRLLKNTEISIVNIEINDISMPLDKFKNNLIFKA